MKKVFFFFSVMFLYSFCVGQYAVSNFDPNDPRFRMEERRDLFKKYINNARNFVKDSEARMICDFLEHEVVMVAPIFLNGEVNFIIGDSAKSSNYIFMMFVFKEDLSLADHFAKMMTMDYVGASYNPDTRVLVIKTWFDVSDAWSSLFFLHEGRHAYESIFTPYNWKERKLFCLHERTTHEFENRLLAKYGGELYESIMRDEIKDLEHNIDSLGINWRQSFLSQSIVPELDKIFGKSKSEVESYMRYTHFWIDKYFRFFDQKCANKAEADRLKDQFLHTLYFNAGVLNR